MVVAAIRLPSSLASLSPHTLPFSWRRFASSLPSHARPLVRPPFQVRLRSESAGGDSEVELSSDRSEMIFVGTGTSEGIPRVSCLTDPLKKCQVCSKATEPGNKNRRFNTSILIRQSSSSGSRNILIDVGKFFYQSALRWFPTLGIRTLDAVIITHSHADAIGGLDDLRDWTNNVQPSIPIYVAERDFEVMKKTHYYLVDTSVIIPGAAVSKLQFNIISEEPFFVQGLKITPLPVWHGQGYRSLGFRFGDVCYISDVSDIPEETYPLLKDCEILILDALRPDRSSSTHFGLPRVTSLGKYYEVPRKKCNNQKDLEQMSSDGPVLISCTTTCHFMLLNYCRILLALDEVRKIQPKRTLFTGMMHLMDHEEVNSYLAKFLESEGLDIQLSYDGLRIPIKL